MNPITLTPPARRTDIGIGASVAIARRPSEDGHGTAWLCGDGIAMTACHVVPADGKLKLTFGNGTRADATMVDHNVEFDVALLRLERIEPPGGLGPVLAIDTDGLVHDRQPWHGWGHPVGYPSGYPVDGTIGGMGYDQGVREMHLRCGQGPAVQLQGISGGPVLDGNGVAIGLFRQALSLIDGALVATRLDDAWKALQQWREAAPKMRSAGPISRYLDESLPIWERTTYATRYRTRERPHIDSVFVEPRFRAANARAPQAANATMGVGALLAQLRNHDRHIVLRGEPGSGKSSLLRWLCLQLAHAWHLGEQRSEVPVLVHASALVGGKSIDDVIAEIDPIFSRPPPPGIHWLILIDGLDEIIDVEDRRIVLASIKHRFALARSRVRPVLRLLLATRPLAMLDEVSIHEATHLVLKPFTSAQIEAFARNWFRSSDPALADDFLAQLKSARLEGPVTTPALAMVTAVVFERSPARQLPRCKADLYDRYIELALSSRHDDVLVRFCEEFEHLYPGEGTAIAQRLWRERDALIEALAMKVQLGELAPDGDNFAQASLDWAVDRKLLVLHSHRPFEKEQLHALFTDMLLSTGLLVTPLPNAMAFQQNPLREALVARAEARDRPHGTAEEIQRFARLWVHVRWREIVSLVLARWSETGALARQAVWDVLRPIMESGNLGTHFVATALAEGLQLGPEAEHFVYDRLIQRSEDWNPCAELFNEFESPNPADALRALADRDAFVHMLVERLRADPTQCCNKAALLVQLAIDVGSIDSVATLLEGSPPVARAASLVIGRAGRVDLVLPQLLAIAADPDDDRLAVAKIVGEEADAATLRDFLKNPSIDPIVRVYTLLHASGDSNEQQSLAKALISDIDLDWTNAEHLHVAGRALAIDVAPAFERASDSTCLTFLRAAGEEGPRLPDLVRRAARRMLTQELPNSERALQIASVLLSHEPSEEEIGLARHQFDLFTGDREALLDLATALARCGMEAPLLELARDHRYSLTRDAAVRLSNAGFQQSARDMLTELAIQRNSKDVLIVDALFVIGETELGLQHCLHGARHDTNFVRRLRTWGYVKELSDVATDLQATDPCRRLAIACLEHLGNFEALLDVAVAPTVPAALALDAARRAHGLGWAPEALAAGEAIAAREDLPSATLDEMEAAAIRQHILSSSCSVEALLKQRSEGSLGYGRHVFEALMERDDLSAEQAINIYANCGGVIPFARLEPLVLGRNAPADALENFVRIALNDGATQAIMKAACELAGPRPVGEDFKRSRLANALQLVVEALRVAVAGDPEESDYQRLYEAGRLQDSSKEARDAAFVALATSPSTEIAPRLEAAMAWMDKNPSPEAEQALLGVIQEVVDGDSLAMGESLIDAILLFDSENFPEAAMESALHVMALPSRPGWRRALATRVADCGHLEQAQPHLEAILADTGAGDGIRAQAALTLAEHGCPQGLQFLTELYASMTNERKAEDVWVGLHVLVNNGFVAEAVRLALLVSSARR